MKQQQSIIGPCKSSNFSSSSSSMFQYTYFPFSTFLGSELSGI